MTRSAPLFAAAIAAAAALAGASAATAQTAIPPHARDFVAMAGQSDAYEIAAAHTALAQSRDPQVRAFAQEMIADHSRVLRWRGGRIARRGDRRHDLTASPRR